jgi:single-strand selective monofunctional uracil DNA glycosylase
MRADGLTALQCLFHCRPDLLFSRFGNTTLATSKSTSQALIAAAKRLSKQMDKMSFGDPVTHVYNPLRYAWKPHEAYLTRCQTDSIRVLFLGMNPGPWGMAQTGVPFGHVASVRDWIGIQDSVKRPDNEHPKRPIEGFACNRSEVSGERLWGLFRAKYEAPERFFEQHFVVNYCPLVFMEASGKNRTPDKLPMSEAIPLQQACDEHLQAVIEILKPEFLVGVGAYAEQCFQRVQANRIDTPPPNILRILHPSPASPAANRNWAATATLQLIEGGVWSPYP